LAGRRLDIAVGLVGASLAAAAAASVDAGVLQSLAAAVFGGALGLARAHPTAAWIVAVGAIAAMVLDRGAATVPLPLLAASAFAAGRWAERRSAIAGVVALIGVSLACAAATHDSPVPFVLVPGIGWFVGYALHERELVVQRLAERAREVDEEREAYAELSVRYERARIASELHDIVAHAISVIVVQASAGQRLAASNPELMVETFDAIAGAAHQAEEDMSRLVELLADERAIGQAPDLELVEELVARAARTGLEVTLTLDGTREGLPSELVQTATRVVQEGLTNALRYASGAPVRVLVSGEHDKVIVEVTNDPAATAAAATLVGHGTGNGLRGLRERLNASGGRLEAGPTADGGWQTRAHIPRHVTAGLT
jgi:signal transduction histidine kinase